MTISSHRKKERKRERSRARLVKQEAKRRWRPGTGENRCGSITWEMYVENIGRNRGKGVKERDERTDMYDNSVNTTLIAIYY